MTDLTRRATDLADANAKSWGVRIASSRDIKMLEFGILSERKRINEIVASFRASVMDGDELSELARLIDSDFIEPQGMVTCESCYAVMAPDQTCKERK